MDFEIMCKKLKYYGIKNIENLWFQNYLTNRKQCVDIGGAISNFKDIKCGVPQGSVLGPLLFLLYINDLPVATDLSTILYADDTTFQMTGGDLGYLYSRANVELSKAQTWFEQTS